jgi:hypothetical protein
LPHESDEVCFLLLRKLQFEDQVEELDRVLQGETAAVMHIRRTVFNTKLRPLRLDMRAEASHGYFDHIAALVNVGFKTAKRKEFCQIEVMLRRNIEVVERRFAIQRCRNEASGRAKYTPRWLFKKTIIVSRETMVLL